MAKFQDRLDRLSLAAAAGYPDHDLSAHNVLQLQSDRWHLVNDIAFAIEVISERFSMCTFLLQQFNRSLIGLASSGHRQRISNAVNHNASAAYDFNDFLNVWIEH